MEEEFQQQLRKLESSLKQDRDPASFRGDFSTQGYEYFEGLNLIEKTEGAVKEAVALLDAPQCPSGKMTLLLDGTQLMLQVH